MAAKSPVRLHDIAAAAQTSVATVSLALSGDPRISGPTRQRVRALSQQLGYRPRRSVRPAVRRAAERMRRLSFGFFAVDRLDTPINAALLEALSQRASEQQIRLELASPARGGQGEDMLGQAIRFGRAVDGLIIMGQINLDQLRQLVEAKIPAVMFGYPLRYRVEDDLPLPVVTSDWQAMGERAAGALLEQGHRRIAFISGELKPNMWHARCLSGYVTAHVHAGLSLDPDLVFTVPEDQPAGPVAAQGIMALQRKPTAYVCINVGTASRFVSAMSDAGERVGAGNVVACGMPHMLDELGLEQFPFVAMDPGKLMDAAITQLRAKCTDPGAVNTTVLVPFNSRHLSLLRPPEA